MKFIVFDFQLFKVIKLPGAPTHFLPAPPASQNSPVIPTTLPSLNQALEGWLWLPSAPFSRTRPHACSSAWTEGAEVPSGYNEVGFHGASAQCPNILICMDRGIISQRPLREASSFRATFFAFPDQGFSSQFGAIVAQLRLTVYIPELLLLRFPHWESKGAADLPGDNLWRVGTQLPLSVSHCHGSLANREGGVLMEDKTRCVGHSGKDI